jgi:hypothetical protein
MKTSDSTFYIDVRDGTLEQHLSSGEVRTFPPASGKSVSSLMIAARDDNPQHKMIFGSTRDGMSAGMCAIRSRDTGEARQSRKTGSRLLASLLSRQ